MGALPIPSKERVRCRGKVEEAPGAAEAKKTEREREEPEDEGKKGHQKRGSQLIPQNKNNSKQE